MVSISSLIAILAYAIALCGITPLFPWLEIVPRSAVVIGLAAGIWQDRTRAWPVKNWMFNAAVVPVFLFYAAQFSRAQPIQPVVSILAIMLAVRLAGPKSGRYYLQSAALSLFCLASSSLFNLSPVFLLYLTVMLVLVAVLMVLLTFYSQDSGMSLPPGDYRKVLAAGLLMPVVSLPLLVLFFPLLPRTPLPLWNFMVVPTTRSAGFGDSVEPGRSQSIGESRVLAFRAEMPRQSQSQLYWRGAVFSKPKGTSWERSAAPAEEVMYPRRLVTQTIYPEPGSSRALLALDAPGRISLTRSKRSPDGTYEWLGPAGRRLTYSAGSVVTGILPTRGGIDRDFYLKLPEKLSPRIRELAGTIRSQAPSDAGRLEKLELFFRNGGFSYSRQGLPTGEHALELFLFESRQGHCEFFASSFALLLRSAGVPSRVVGGYLGGEYNDLGGYYLVIEDMAHAWVEAYIEGKGWVRIDPSSFAANAGTVWGGAHAQSPMLRLRLMLDSLDHSWNRMVITYDSDRQVEAALNAGRRFQGIKVSGFLSAAIPYLLLLFLVAGISAMFVFRSRIFISREERLLRRFYRQIEREYDLPVQRGKQGLFEIVAASGNPGVRAFVDIYAGAVYRDRKLTDDEYEQLLLIMRQKFRETPS